MATNSSSSKRLAFLDWMRGLAAIIMLNGHVFHSFTRPEDRGGPAYQLTQFIGGMPPAIFLFLLGVTLAFLMESRERQGLPGKLRVLAAVRRAGYLLGIAFLFRLQMFVFGWPHTQVSDLWRVDILNAMGLAVVVMSVLALAPTALRVRLAAMAGLLIAFASPLVSQLKSAGLPAPLAAYIVPDSLAFAFFPWAAFVAFGVSAGSILRLIQRQQMDRFMQWSALAGLILIVVARFCADLPYSLYPSSNFWLDSPWLVFIKLGVMLLIMSAAFLWTEYGAGPGWSWVRQFGTTSLLVYWVHTELVYGRWLYFWKESLTPAQCAAASVGVVLSMLGLSLLRTNWKSVTAWLASLARPFPAEPSRVPGD